MRIQRCAGRPLRRVNDLFLTTAATDQTVQHEMTGLKQRHSIAIPLQLKIGTESVLNMPGKIKVGTQS